MDELDPAEGYMGMMMRGFTRRAAAYGIHPFMLAPRRRLPIVHQPITFTTTDFEGVKPHDDDPIVVKLRIKKYDVERVIIDPGSAANIMYVTPRFSEHYSSAININITLLNSF